MKHRVGTSLNLNSGCSAFVETAAKINLHPEICRRGEKV